MSGRAVALQGIGYGGRAVALQGLLTLDEESVTASVPAVALSGDDLRRMVLEALARNRAEPPPLPAIHVAPSPSTEQLAEYTRVGRALTARVRRAVRS